MSAISNTLAQCLSGVSSETESERAAERQSGVTEGMERIMDSTRETLEKLQGRFLREAR